ncbi:MAG TPA: ABC transporter substrate-binding protein [Candidatus Saccharimonas sp.]|nr:ABC transporter substrate-binding protein [Candidatus Saccharimonas sp.]
MFDYVRFRYRRMVRRFRRDLRLLERWAINYVDRHIWGKWHQFGVVRRFLLTWFGVLAITVIGVVQQTGGLQRAEQIAVPALGGTYSEAAVGRVQTLNPVLPESELSGDINRLIFSGLTRYNANRTLVADLAERWEVSPDGRVYTFYLRKNVKWQDGVPFTSADVAFTLTAIQTPDSRSPLASSWQGVTVETRGDYTVVFTLPQPLASFLDSTTIGIVPRHLLESIDPSQLREASFNQQPIGTGPFQLKTFAPSAHEIALTANPHYYGGRPNIADFIFRFYDTPEAAMTAYAQHQVTSPGRVLPTEASRRGQLVGLSDYDLTLPEETVLFFQTTDDVLKDKDLRGVLSRSLQRGAIASQATAGQGVVVSQPLLPGQLGYTPKYGLTSLSPEAAAAALDGLGWTQSRAGAVRQKAGQPLKLQLVTLSGGELELAAKEIRRQWAKLGIQVELKTVDATDLQQTYMRPRNFQLLLFGINLGADPDVYPFWHSSQAKDPGVNLSSYASADADKALEAARVKTDPVVRAGKYDSFLKAWNADAPAAILYETAYQYAVSEDVAGITASRLVTPADRFYNVEHWTVRRTWADLLP